VNLSILREQLIGDATQVAVVLRLQRLKAKRILGRIESVLEQTISHRAAVDVVAYGIQFGYPYRRTNRQAIAKARRYDARRKEETAIVLGGRKGIAEFV